jgi:hypothetical protein
LFLSVDGLRRVTYVGESIVCERKTPEGWTPYRDPEAENRVLKAAFTNLVELGILTEVQGRLTI